jgi:hypothetical protein
MAWLRAAINRLIAEQYPRPALAARGFSIEAKAKRK